MSAGPAARASDATAGRAVDAAACAPCGAASVSANDLQTQLRRPAAQSASTSRRSPNWAPARQLGGAPEPVRSASAAVAPPTPAQVGSEHSLFNHNSTRREVRKAPLRSSDDRLIRLRPVTTPLHAHLLQARRLSSAWARSSIPQARRRKKVGHEPCAMTL